MTARSRLAAVALAVTLAVPGCQADGRTPPPSAAPAPASSAAAPGPTSSSTPGSTPSSTPAPAAALARFYGQRVSWRACGDSFGCAEIRVPRDYAAPAAGTINLSAVRLPASDRSRRVGSLLVNPGGPGSSAIDYARAATSIVSPEIRARYDIVGVDPRGVGASTPLRCQTAPETDRFLASDGSPDDAAEQRAAVDLARGFAARCAQRAGALLGLVGTENAARDMDVVRAVLGDDRLHYLGKSYGTLLGATYAELFPQRVGRLVLDGAIDPAADGRDIDEAQARGFELALGAFAEDCVRRKDCPLPGPREAAVRAVGDLLEGLDARPLPTKSGRPLTQSLGVLGVAVALYDRGSWTVLRQALDRARAGEGDTLLLLADFYADRNRDGTYASNTNDAIYAVNCLDRPYRPDLATVIRQADVLAKASPTFGRYLAWGSLPCGYWPAPATGRPHRITAPGAAPILVVGTERDPATPVEWARALADQLESGELLLWDGDGHTAYRHGSTCVDQAVDRYLLEGRAPADGTRCR